MDERIENLREWGCDIKGAMERVLDDEELYLELVQQVADGDECARLGDTIAAGNVTGSFELAHMLKGMLGNMGLTQMYEAACDIVEKLRPGAMVDVSEPYGRLCAGYDVLRAKLGTSKA